jgi:hypothetical protein
MKPIVPPGRITDLEEFEAATPLAVKGMILVTFADGRWAYGTLPFTNGEPGDPILTEMPAYLPDLLRTLGMGDR